MSKMINCDVWKQGNVRTCVILIKVASYLKHPMQLFETTVGQQNWYYINNVLMEATFHKNTNKTELRKRISKKKAAIY